MTGVCTSRRAGEACPIRAFDIPRATPNCTRTGVEMHQVFITGYLSGPEHTLKLTVLKGV